MLGSLRASVSSLLDFNSATLSGAVDVVAVRDADGGISCTPFHVRFGKLQLLKSREKMVRISVNGTRVALQMKLDAAGEAFFLQPCDPADADVEDTGSVASSSPPRSPRAGAEAEGPPPLSLDGLVVHPPPELPPTPPPSPPAGPPLPGPLGALGDDELAPSAVRSWWEWEWGGRPMVPSRRSSESDESLLSALRAAADGSVTFSSPDSSPAASPPASPPGTPGNNRGVVRSLMGYIRRRSPASSPTLGPAPAPAPAPTLTPDASAGSATTGDDDDVIFDGWEMHAPPLMSLCGHVLAQATSRADALRLFAQHVVSFEHFRQNPHVLEDPNLLFLVRGRLCSWRVAAPFLVSALVFGRPLDDAAVNALAEEADRALSGEGWGRWFRRGGGIDEDLLKSPVLSPTPASEPAAADPPAFRKALRPTEEQLQALELRDGRNTLEFTVVSALQGERTVPAELWVFSPTQKLVVSDIDGTITKSDALGHVAPLLGRDWSHKGVADLYRRIEAQGYKIFYLTSRAIGQAGVTRQYLTTVVGSDGQPLPPGPILLSPNRLLESFAREIIYRRPEEFKIHALQGVRDLFPKTPFHAGFGNRESDVVSYQAVGVPSGRIFVIRTDGVLCAAGNRSMTKSYELLEELVHAVFPPPRAEEPAHQYSCSSFWRVPIPALPSGPGAGSGSESDDEVMRV